MAEHLLAVGRRRPVLLTGPLDLPSARDRREGFLGAWHGEIAFEAAVPFRHELAAEVRREMEDPTHGFDAVVAANDAVAIGVLRVLRRIGIPVPEAVCVVGVDDVPWSALSSPALTTVRQPVRALGREAVQLLLRRIERPDQPRRLVTLPVRLVVRESSPSLRPGRPARPAGGASAADDPGPGPGGAATDLEGDEA